jgi:hypothetical protein
VRFFLPEQSSVAVTVHQLRADAPFYLLDHVSQQDWQYRAVNEFKWSTLTVLQRVQMQPQDLGAVVSLAGPAMHGSQCWGTSTDKGQYVLPAVLFDDAVSVGSKTYRFTFSTDSSLSEIGFEICDPEGKTVVPRKPQPQVIGLFPVTWSAGTSKEGWYHLRLYGRSLSGSEVGLEFDFFHRPVFAESSDKR